MSRRNLQPYPGLRAFERYESCVFFGRQKQTDELLNRLKKHHFLAVIGASGSGKSSLVKAGLLPGLEKGYMGEVGSRWSIAEMRPGGQPFAMLADALLNDALFFRAWNNSGTVHADETQAHFSLLTAELRRGSRSLHEILSHSPLPDGAKLLLLIDQFEEIFRFREKEANEATAFVSLLLEACKHEDIYAVITMRSDFLGAAAEFHGLPEAINSGLYLTPRLSREQLREAVCMPAELFGGAVEDTLANHLLNEAGNDPDQLPLLQHALMRLWDNDQDKILTFQEYEGMYDLRGALNGHAEQVWAELDQAGQSVVEVMFRALTERGRDGQDVRRPLKVQRLLELTGVDVSTLASIIDRFRQPGRNFLMPSAVIPLSRDTMLDISHESLIRQWTRLQGWVSAEAKKALMYQRLLDAAQRHSRGEGELWHGTDLALALEWQDETKPDAVWAERYESHFFTDADAQNQPDSQKIQEFTLARNFLKKSEQEAQRQHQEQETIRKKELSRTRQLFVVSFMGFIIAMALAAWGFSASNRAESERRHAEVAKVNALREAQRARNAEEVARAEAEKTRIANKKVLAQTALAEAAKTRALHEAIRARKAEKVAQEESEKTKVAEKNAYNLVEVTIKTIVKQNDEDGVKKYIQNVFDADQKNTLLLLLKPLISETKSMDDDEREYWRNILPSMTDKQIVRLVEILFIEREKLHDLEEKYRNVIHSLNTKLDSLTGGLVDYEKSLKDKLVKNPKDSRALADYAELVLVYQKDFDKAGNLYERAIAADPKNADILGNYAVFMKDIRKDYNRAEELYKRAIAADPKHARSLGNYAIFMKNIRKDYNRAEELYKRAIAADPKRADILGNYANFVCDIRKDYNRAEALYKRAIAVDPKNADILGNYAIFMTQIRKDYNRAEELYKRAIAADPKHANSLINDAQLKLIRGDYKNGRSLIDRAVAANPEEPQIKMEIWFYRLAHFPKEYPQATKEIVRLLKSGARDDGWDFSGNIARARQDGHKNVALLQALSDVIVNKAKFESLPLSVRNSR